MLCVGMVVVIAILVEINRWLIREGNNANVNVDLRLGEE